MPRAIAIAVVLSIGLFLPLHARAADAKEFAPRSKTFTIMMPAGEQSENHHKILHIGGKAVAIESAEIATSNGTIFVGASVGVPAVALRDIPRDKRLDAIGEMIVKAINGQITGTKDLMQDPVPGKEFAIKNPQGVARLQLYMNVGHIMYAVVQGKTDDEINSKTAGDFFASLKLSDSLKESYSKINKKK